MVTNDALPTIFADEQQIVQLFQNLIGNALKFKGDRTPEIHVGANEKPDAWEIYVQDNGIGIKSDSRERIFVIFQRLHNREEYEGTGIGLAICKKIVERHQGKIWVDKIGSRITLLFHYP